MAIARDTTADNIKPLNGAIIRRFTAGAAVAAGEIVSMQNGRVLLVVVGGVDELGELS